MDAPVPFGWEGWRLQLASLKQVRSLSLAGGPGHTVQGCERPRLLLGGPIPGVTTPYNSPVHAEAPQLSLPDAADSVISWHVDIRPAAGGPALVSREFDQPGAADIWAGVPRPILGAFDITVRGPLGRGTRRTVFIAEGISVRYEPAVRALRVGGLEPGQADIHVPVGAAASPARLSFGVTDRARMAELRAGPESEPVVITPPHVDLLCAGVGTSTWTAAPIHAATEAIADLGRLLVRVPGAVVSTDLEVWAGRQRIQTIPPSGGQAAGLTGYDLPRASETVAHHGRAELFLPWGQTVMPVGFVRPRRLTAGAAVVAGRLEFQDCVPAEGLTAAVYLTRAPWRPPVVLPVPREGTAELPVAVREAGPLRVLLRVDDPWIVSEWPAWPGRSSYACDAPGVPVGADPDEDALIRFLAGEDDLPVSPGRVDRLWRLVQLATDLIGAGAPANLRERCAAVLRERPGPAVAALLETGSDTAACAVGLISTGLATARPEPDGEASIAEQLWGTLPAAAAILCSSVLAQAADSGGALAADIVEAAQAQCGPSLSAVLSGAGDPCAQVGQFGPDAERMALLSADQIEAVWQAAVVVPQALLDADTRAIAARQMFDARRTTELSRAAREAGLIVRAAERLVAASPYPCAAAPIAARRHPGGKGGWLALPAMSIAMAVVARIAARGHEASRSFERSWREHWTGLARQAPDLASIDLVLAEAHIASAERARPAGEQA